VVIICVLVTEIFKLFYEKFFMVLFVVLFVVILRLVFVALDANIRVLQEIFTFMTASQLPNTAPLHSKLKLFYTIKIGFRIDLLSSFLSPPHFALTIVFSDTFSRSPSDLRRPQGSPPAPHLLYEHLDLVDLRAH